MFRNKKLICIFLICFISTFLYDWLVKNIFADVIWNYGYAYNLSLGAIPYRDFNLLTPPLYHLLGAGFIKIFGNHLYSVAIFNSFVTALVMTLCYQKLGKSIWIFLLVILSYMVPTYNYFSLLLLLVVLLLVENQKISNKESMIGFLIGCIFLSKQTIGICLFAIVILFSKKRIKYVIGFLIPCLFALIYLLYYDIFFDFINYCFLGMMDFGNHNTYISFLHFPIFLGIVAYLCYLIQKTKFNDLSLLLVLGFQVVAVPIFDAIHVMLGFLAMLFYIFLRNKNHILKNYKYYFVIALSLVFFKTPIDLFKNDKHFIYHDEDSFLNGKVIYGEYLNYQNCISILEDYVKKTQKEYSHIFIFSDEITYTVKINLGQRLNQFDMIAYGNMGYDGIQRRFKSLDHICEKDSCMFIVDEGTSMLFSQTSTEILNYPQKYFLIDSIQIGYFNNLDQDLVFSVYDNIGIKE